MEHSTAIPAKAIHPHEGVYSTYAIIIRAYDSHDNLMLGSTMIHKNLSSLNPGRVKQFTHICFISFAGLVTADGLNWMAVLNLGCLDSSFTIESLGLSTPLLNIEITLEGGVENKQTNF